jgi:RimJ/RimL family protein N-acetyltransferase
MTPPLTGRFVKLLPYADSLKAELRTALDVDQDAWRLFSRAGFGEHFDAWWEDSMRMAQAGNALNYAILDPADGRVVGSTSFLNLRPKDRVGEIGATFLRPEVRAGRVNPDAKRLMLAHAFEGGLFGGEAAHRVEIVTDARNLRSQGAIAKLGAVREGVLRSHKATWTGHVRDTVIFSVITEEWPAVRERLDARLDAFA